MDNLTHSLVGLVAAKAGLERTSPYATTLCVVAANAPDADLCLVPFGRWVYLEHHRGLSHSIVGVACLALLLPLIFYGGERLAARLRQRPARARFGGLLLSSLLLSASHPLMDWTNNYGVRPLLPWDASRFYGDLVFIVDPWLWLALGGAAFLLTTKKGWRTYAWALLAAVLTAAVLFFPGRPGITLPSEARMLWLTCVAALWLAHATRLRERLGAGIAVAALSFVLLYWGALAALHARALVRARAFAAETAARSGEELWQVAAMPTLGSPVRWLCVAETNRAHLRFETRVRSDENSSGEGRDVLRIEKPDDATRLLVERARRDERANVFLRFARFPVVRIRREADGRTVVQLAALRYTEPGQGRGSFALDVPLPDASDK